MSCEIKSIEEFCSEFKSVDMNLSGGSSAPTIEVSIIGGQSLDQYGSLDKKKLVSSIISKLKSSGIVEDDFHNLWDVNRISRSDSESGVITEISLVDSVWKKANFFQVGLADRSFGDIRLGKEYFDVRGVFFDTIERDSLNNFLIEKSVYESNFNDLNFGRKYLNSSGQFVDIPTNTNSESWIDNISDSIPDPRIEFGEVYYTFNDLLDEIDNYAEYFLGVTPTGSGHIVEFEGMGTDLPVGLMNETGSLFEIMNKVASRHGAIFIANGFVGFKMLKIQNNFGKISDIKSDDNTVISVPQEAVSSRLNQDYSSGFSIASSLTVLSPGRYPTQKEEDLENADNSTAQKKVFYYSSQNNTSSFINFDRYLRDSAPFLSAEAIAWSIIRGLPILEEFGRAVFIRDGGDAASSELTKLASEAYPVVPDNYTWYTGFGNLSANFISLAASNLGFSSLEFVTNPASAAALQVWFANYNRFAVCKSIGGKGISLNGDISGAPPYGAACGSTIGWNQFGTVNYPSGSPNWSSSSGVPMSFVLGTAPITSTPFAFVSEFGSGGNASEIMASSNSAGMGAIILDMGENSAASLDLSGDYGSLECFVDETQSLRDDAGAAFAGIAAINYSGLSAAVLNIYNALASHYGSILGSLRGRSAPMVSVQGEFDPAPTRVGSSSGYEPENNDGQTTVVNDKVKVKRDSTYHQCGNTATNSSSGSSSLNRKVFNFNASYSFSNVTKFDPTANGVEDKYYTVPYKYIPSEGRVEEGAYYSSCDSPSVEYLEKISFVTKNKPFDMKSGWGKYLENLSISIIDGQATFSYRFSHQPLTPDYKGLGEAKISLQNLIN